MTEKNKKILFHATKAILILVLVSYVFIIQSFTPLLSQESRPCIAPCFVMCDLNGCSCFCPPSSSGCPNLMCSNMCYGFDPKTCKCLPLGCGGSTTSSSSSSGLICRPPCILDCDRFFPSCKCICPTSSSSGSCNIKKCSSRCYGFDPKLCQCLPLGCGGSTTSSSSSSGIVCRPPCILDCDRFFPSCKCICPTSSSSGSCNIKKCPSRCYGFDPKLCQCLPLGCGRGTSLATSSSSSGSSNFDNLPSCENNQVTCNSGLPKCDLDNKPICGSELGLDGDLAGPGCTDAERTFFEESAVFCSLSSRKTSLSNIVKCKKKNICPKNKKRTEACREDRSLCRCICQFKIRNERHIPRCNSNDKPVCSGGLIPICSNSKNTPVCKNRKLLCEDLDVSLIDLVDKVFCK